MTTKRRQPKKSGGAGALLAAARARIIDGDLTAAKRLIREAIAQAPSDPETFHLLGVVHELQGEPLEAQKHYRAALEFGVYEPSRRNLERLVIGGGRGKILLGTDEEPAGASDVAGTGDRGENNDS